MMTVLSDKHLAADSTDWNIQWGTKVAARQDSLQMPSTQGRAQGLQLHRNNLLTVAVNRIPPVPPLMRRHRATGHHLINDGLE